MAIYRVFRRWLYRREIREATKELEQKEEEYRFWKKLEADAGNRSF